jgi:hypothetical protein
LAATRRLATLFDIWRRLMGIWRWRLLRSRIGGGGGGGVGVGERGGDGARGGAELRGEGAGLRGVAGAGCAEHPITEALHARDGRWKGIGAGIEDLAVWFIAVSARHHDAGFACDAGIIIGPIVAT